MATFNELWNNRSQQTSQQTNTTPVGRPTFNTLFSASPEERKALISRRKEDEERKRKAKEYAERFFSQAETSDFVFTVAGGLKKRADAGDVMAQEQLMAVLTDERMKEYTQPNNSDVASSVASMAGMDEGVQKSIPELGDYKLVNKTAKPLNIAQQGATIGAGLVDAVVDPYRRMAKSFAHNLPLVRNAKYDLDKDRNKLIDELGSQIKMLREIISNPNVSKRRRENAQIELNKALREMVVVSEEQGVDAKETMDLRNNVKTVAAGGEIMLDLAGGALLKNIANTPAKTAKAAKKLNKIKIGAGGAIGSGIGATSAVQNDSNVLQGAAIGGLLGTVTAGAGVGYGKYKAKVLANEAAGVPSKNPLRKIKNPIRAVETQISEKARPITQAIRRQADRIPGVKVTLDKAGAFVDAQNILKKPLRGLKDDEGYDIAQRLDDFMTKINNSNAEASYRLTSNPALKQLLELVDTPKTMRGKRELMKQFGEFVSKKQTAINHNKLVTQSGKGALVDVPVGTKEQEAFYRGMNELTKDAITRLRDGHMISKATYKKWMEDGDYTRVQREVENVLDKAYEGGSGLNSSFNVAKQKLKGDGGKDAVDPMTALLDYYYKAYGAKAVRDHSKYLLDVYTKHGVKARPIVTAQNTKIRQEAWGELLQNNAMKKKLLKIEKSQKKYINTIERELLGVNKKLEKAGTKLTKKQLADINAAKKSGRVKKYKGVTILDKKKGASVYHDGVKLDFPTQKAARDYVSTQIAPDYKKPDIAKITQLPETKYKQLKARMIKKDAKLKEAFKEIDVIRKDIERSAAYNKTLRKVMQEHADGVKAKNTPTLKVWRDGIKELYEIEPEIYRQLNRNSDVMLEGWQKLAMDSSRLLRFGATAGNPVFAIKNVMRDQFTSFVNSEDIFATHNPISIGRGLKEAIVKPGARNTLGRFLKEDNFVRKMMNPSKEFEQFLSQNDNITRIDLARQLDGSVKEMQRIMGIRRKTPLRVLEDIIASSEKAGRYQNWIGTYKKSLAGTAGTAADMSKAMQAANRASAHNSINFALRGEQDRFLRIFNPYLNAGIQGSRQLARSLIDRPLSTSMKITGAIIAPAVALTRYNLIDPQRAEVYASIASSRPDILENNFVFIKSDGRAITIPLPPGINKLVNPFRNYVEAQYIGDRNSFFENAVEMAGAFSPIGTSKGEAFSTIIPQILAPAVEGQSNYSFYYGDSIIPDNMEDLDPEDQSYDSTPQMAKDIGEALGISPLIVMHYVRGYTAGFGTQAMGNIDEVLGRDGGGKDIISETKEVFLKDKPAGGVWGKFYDGGKGYTGYDELSRQKRNNKKGLAEIVRSDYNSPEIEQKAKEWNDSIQTEIDKAKNALQNEYGRYQTGEHKDSGQSTTEIQLTMLESLKYQFEKGKVKNSEKYNLLLGN